MNHLSREELQEWRDRGAAADRERILSHLAACRTCAAEYAELSRTAPVLEQPARFDPADFVQHGYAVQRRLASSRQPLWMSWKVWAGVLSTAALVVLVATLGPSGGIGDDTRGTSIEVTAPAAVTDRGAVVSWRSGLARVRYRVELLDANGDRLFETTTEATTVTLPADRVSQLTPGRSLIWKITALDTEGEAITSASQAFSIAGAGPR